MKKMLIKYKVLDPTWKEDIKVECQQSFDFLGKWFSKKTLNPNTELNFRRHDWMIYKHMDMIFIVQRDKILMRRKDDEYARSAEEFRLPMTRKDWKMAFPHQHSNLVAAYCQEMMVFISLIQGTMRPLCIREISCNDLSFINLDTISFLNNGICYFTKIQESSSIHEAVAIHKTKSLKNICGILVAPPLVYFFVAKNESNEIHSMSIKEAFEKQSPPTKKKFSSTNFEKNIPMFLSSNRQRILVHYNDLIIFHRDKDGNFLREKVISSKIFDAKWWNNDSVVFTRFDGTLSIQDIHSDSNILGDQAEKFDGLVRLTEVESESLFLLESLCDEKAYEKEKKRLERNLIIKQKQKELETRNLPYFKRLIVSLVRWFWENDEVPCNLSYTMMYTLMQFSNLDHKKEFMDSINSGNFDRAQFLANKFPELDIEMIHKKKWDVSPVTRHSISNYLKNVTHDQEWILDQTLSRMSSDLRAMVSLFQIGLQVSARLLKSHYSNDFDLQSFDRKILDGNFVNEKQIRLLSEKRKLLMQFEDRLKTFQEMQQYDEMEYSIFRECNLLKYCEDLAQNRKFRSLKVIWSHHPMSVVDKLRVLDEIPHSCSPLKYQALLPAISGDQVTWHYQVEPWRSTLTSDSVSKPDMISQVAAWISHRARAIDSICGFSDFSLELINLAVSNQIPNLFHLQHSFGLLNCLVYECGHSGLTYVELESLTDYEIISMLMNQRTAQEVLKKMKKYGLEILERNEPRSGTDSIIYQCFVNILSHQTDLKFCTDLIVLCFENKDYNFVDNATLNLVLLDLISKDQESIVLHIHRRITNESILDATLLDKIQATKRESSCKEKIRQTYGLNDELQTLDDRYKALLKIIFLANDIETLWNDTEVILGHWKDIPQHLIHKSFLERILSSIETCGLWEKYSLLVHLSPQELDEVLMSSAISSLKKVDDIHEDDMTLSKKIAGYLSGQSANTLKMVISITIFCYNNFEYSLLPRDILELTDPMQILNLIIRKNEISLQDEQPLMLLAKKLFQESFNDQDIQYFICDSCFQYEKADLGVHLLQKLLVSHHPRSYELCKKEVKTQKLPQHQIQNLLNFALFHCPGNEIYSILEEFAAIDQTEYPPLKENGSIEKIGMSTFWMVESNPVFQLTSFSPKVSRTYIDENSWENICHSSFLHEDLQSFSTRLYSFQNPMNGVKVVNQILNSAQTEFPLFYQIISQIGADFSSRNELSKATDKFEEIHRFATEAEKVLSVQQISIGKYMFNPIYRDEVVHELSKADEDNGFDFALDLAISHGLDSISLICSRIQAIFEQSYSISTKFKKTKSIVTSEMIAKNGERLGNLFKDLSKIHSPSNQDLKYFFEWMEICNVQYIEGVSNQDLIDILERIIEFGVSIPLADLFNAKTTSDFCEMVSKYLLNMKTRDFFVLVSNYIFSESDAKRILTLSLIRNLLADGNRTQVLTISDLWDDISDCDIEELVDEISLMDQLEFETRQELLNSALKYAESEKVVLLIQTELYRISVLEAVSTCDSISESIDLFRDLIYNEHSDIELFILELILSGYHSEKISIICEIFCSTKPLCEKFIATPKDIYVSLLKRLLNDLSQRVPKISEDINLTTLPADQEIPLMMTLSFPPKDVETNLIWMRKIMLSIEDSSLLDELFDLISEYSTDSNNPIKAKLVVLKIATSLQYTSNKHQTLFMQIKTLELLRSINVSDTFLMLETPGSNIWDKDWKSILETLNKDSEFQVLNEILKTWKEIPTYHTFLKFSVFSLLEKLLKENSALLNTVCDEHFTLLSQNSQISLIEKVEDAKKCYLAAKSEFKDVVQKYCVSVLKNSKVMKKIFRGSKERELLPIIICDCVHRGSMIIQYPDICKQLLSGRITIPQHREFEFLQHIYASHEKIAFCFYFSIEYFTKYICGTGRMMNNVENAEVLLKQFLEESKTC